MKFRVTTDATQKTRQVLDLIGQSGQKAARRCRTSVAKARVLLQLEPGPTNHHFMASPAIFYPDWVLALRGHLEQRHGKSWQQVLLGAGSFSEFQLYGVFVEEILKPVDLLVRKTPYHIGVWQSEDAKRLICNPRAYLASVPYAPITLVFQSNLGIDVEAYRGAIDQLLDF